MQSAVFLAYYRWCKKYGPDQMTFSAYAWKVKSWWVKPIDAAFGLFGQVQHCRSQFERETKEGPRTS